MSNQSSMKKLLGPTIIALALFVYASSATAATQTDTDPNGNRSTCINLTKDLGVTFKDTDTGGEVSDLQFYLQGSGYLNSEPTGYFGLQTFAAVQAFQTAHHITPATGYVGPLTRYAINSELCVSLSNVVREYDEDAPSITLTAKADGKKSMQEITVQSDEKFTISGKPENLKGVKYGTDDDEFTASWVFGRLLNNSCTSNKFKATNLWELKCKVEETGSTEVYAEIYKDDNTYTSNKITVSIVGEDDSSDDDEEEDDDDDFVQSKDDVRYQPQINMIRSIGGEDWVLYPGERAVIEGNHLVYSGKDAVVRVGNVRAQILQYSEDNIYFVVPNLQSRRYKVYLSTDYGSDSDSVDLVDNSYDADDYAPVITNLGAGNSEDFVVYVGEPIYIEGNHLVYAGKDARVFIGGKEATVTQYNEHTLIFTGPKLATGVYELYVKTEYGSSEKVEVNVR